jgi:hypothetical protein
LLLSSNIYIYIYAPFYVLSHESSNWNKLKVVGVHHNISTDEELTHAKHLNFFKDVHNYLQCTQGKVINVSINKGDCHTLNL